MAKHTGGSKVGGGYYWNPRTWEVVTIGVEGGTLPGSGGFLEIHWGVVFALLPVMGALFLMFLPVVGFALLGQLIFKRFTGIGKVVATEVLHNMAPGPIPGEAHLTGKPAEQKEDKKIFRT